MAELLFYDRFHIYNKHNDDATFLRWFEVFLNSTLNRGGRLISDELPKEPWEVIIVEWTQKRVREYLNFFNRSKKIDIPVSMVYIVSDKKKYDSIFVKGIVVERSSSECYFAAKLFQELFCRECFCEVVSDQYRNVYVVDSGTAVFKKGIASLLARDYIKRSIAEGLFNAVDFSEELFDRDSEKALSLFLQDFCLLTESISEDDCFKLYIESIINEKSFSEVRASKKENSARLISLEGIGHKVLSSY